MSRIKELRVSSGLKQKELARALGISQQTMSRLENTDPLHLKMELVVKVAKYFGVTTDYILELSDQKYDDAMKERMHQYSEKYGELLSEFEDLKPEYQEAVQSVMQSFLEKEEK